MQAISRTLTVLALLIAAPVQATPAESGAQVGSAMTALRGGDWLAAAEAAGQKGSVSADIIEWHRLRAGRGTAAEITDFLARRSDWPGLDWLRRKSEPAMAAAGTEAILAFFADTPPQTAEGVLAHAHALTRNGEEGEAKAALVLAWRTMPMGRTSHQVFLRDYGPLLKPHHAARVDRLIWDGHLDSAERMLPVLDDAHRKLTEARLALRAMAAGVDTKIAAVPASLQDSPGLAYERFVWRLRKKRWNDAIALMMDHSSDAESLGEPSAWAHRRVDLARQKLQQGEVREAYDIAASHHTVPDDGYVHAELEWLAGFIALRRLDRPEVAIEHFRRFDAAVLTPISKGRGGYWLGRALEAAGRKDEAQTAYAEGAKHQTSFYGLLAAERAGLPFDPELENPPSVPPWREAGFMSSTVLEAGLMLLAAGEVDLAERFLTHLVESLDDVQAAQLGEMAVEMGRAHLAVMISKRAARQATLLHAAYYPLHPLGEMELPMAEEMSLAIARRESEFDPGVISGAGARGLMQVMPATARAVADRMGILAAHDTSRLTSDWKYNAKLGANYLAGLAGDLGGNVVMMSAGYNAGPGRPMRWMQIYGDPRSAEPQGDEAVVDWIESIPFDETRNYVMRVTESLPVYRARLGKDPLPIPFSAELTGSTLLPFAP